MEKLEKSNKILELYGVLTYLTWTISIINFLDYFQAYCWSGLSHFPEGVFISNSYLSFNVSCGGHRENILDREGNMDSCFLCPSLCFLQKGSVNKKAQNGKQEHTSAYSWLTLISFMQTRNTILVSPC